MYYANTHSKSYNVLLVNEGWHCMNLTLFLVYCFIMTITPGPTNIMILSTVHHQGVKKALWFSYGSILGFGISLFLAALFNAILARFVPTIMVFMQYFGALYLLYLAYLIATTDAHTSHLKKEAGSFKKGLLLQFINPKVILFCVSVFPSFILPYYTSSLALSVFVLIITAIGAFSFFVWVFFGSFLARWTHRYPKTINALLASCLMYTSLMISGWMD